MKEQNNTKNKKCYFQARSFYYAAKRCGKTEECEESGLPQSLSIPEYVNLAFSCELYFKSFLYKNSEIIKEHKLLELYNMLDKELKEKILKMLSMNEEEIILILKEHSNLFVDMRYQFELSHYNESFSVPRDFFYKLAETLDNLVQDKYGVDPYPYQKPSDAILILRELLGEV